MRIPRNLIVGAAATLLSTGLGAQTTASHWEDPLSDLVGRWQSDTVDGASIAYDCELAPGSALVCTEALSRAGTVKRWLGVYVPDSLPLQYLYYEIAGTTASPAPVAIKGHIWIFAGGARDSDGLYHRSIHDYTERNGTFVGLKESSSDGVHWTVERRSVVRRKRPLVEADGRWPS